MNRRTTSFFPPFLFILLILTAGADSARCEKLPIRIYTIADGLLVDQVRVIRQDSRHYLWFGTPEGLTWFDGNQFVSYTTGGGLPHRSVGDILLARDGKIWVATQDGICLFHHAPAEMSAHGGKPFFEIFRPQVNPPDRFAVNCLAEAEDGSIWCGTDHGLFMLFFNSGKGAFQDLNREFQKQTGITPDIRQLALDAESRTLWLATRQGLFSRRPDGRIIRWDGRLHFPDPRTYTVNAGTGGEVWAGTYDGLFLLTFPSGSDSAPAVQVFTNKDGLPANHINALMISPSGRIWVGTKEGIARMDRDSRTGVFTIRCYTTDNGLNDQDITAFAEDNERNLWFGTGRGIHKINLSGIVTFGRPDGLDDSCVVSLFRDGTGQVCARLKKQSSRFIVYDGGRFIQVPLPGLEKPVWTAPQSVLQDHRGEWWIASGEEGLWRYTASPSFTGLGGRRPVKIYTKKDGLPANTVFSIFEDSRKDIWIGLADGYPHLAKWERRTGRFHTWNIMDLPTAFHEDPAGNIWIGGTYSGVWRYRRGHLEKYGRTEQFPPGYILNFYTGSRGQLWISNNESGAIRVPDPDAGQPRFLILTTRDGLASNHIRFICENRWGMFYLGTPRGLDCWDPRTGSFKHFTTADGLAANLQNVILQGDQGVYWLGTWYGLSRFQPEPPRRRDPPGIRVREIRLGGIPWLIDELGQEEVAGIEVPAERNRIAISFAGTSYAPGEALTYRFRLAGIDREWQSLGHQHSLDLVNVRPGSYRIEIQAINAEGKASRQPAVIGLTILAPLWQRWWFITSIASGLATLVFFAVRIRVRRKLDMERVRTRIATDLHDDIGSSLSQIAILSEVAVHRLPGDPPAAVELLGQVSTTARTLVDAMSDIVWAINPSRDRFGDLIHRMRRFANDLFAEGTIAHVFQAGETYEQLPLGHEARRQVYLVFKECLHNVVRHSRAKNVEIRLDIQSGWLEMEIRDDGTGFDTAAGDVRGHGLQNLRNRARSLGGQLDIDSRPGSGTRIRLRLRVASRLRPRWGRHR